MASSKAKSFALPAICDLDALDTIRDGLIDLVERNSVAVSGRAVERVSTNTLLMLLSAAETARRNNFSFEITEASEAMLFAIGRLGLDAGFASMMKG